MMKKTKNAIALLVMLTVSLSGYAQSKMGRYHKNLLYEANIYFYQGDYYYASELYTELIKIEPENTELLERLGICYYHLPPLKDQAERYLKMAVKLDGVDAYYYLALLRIADYRFYDALTLLETYEKKSERTKTVEEIEHLKATAERAITMVQAPLAVTITNLGEEVNTSLHDYAPVWDMNGNKLLFTSRRKLDSKSVKDVSEQFDENIFLVDLNAEPLRAEAAPEIFNSRTNDAAVACSPDGNSLIIYRTSRDGFSGDLYLSKREHYSWSALEKLDEKINSKYQEASASFGYNDPDVLYFSSDREGGYGGKDLYVVRRLPDGNWGEPMNLGPNVNTKYDEDAPFMAADGVLYFASKGHTTMGGFDIFMTREGEDGWEVPANIGYPINTPGDDIFFSIDPTGSHGYFSSERLGGFGLQDLYKVSFDENNTIILRGTLTAGQSIPSNATITLMAEKDGTIEGMYQSDPREGTFVLALNTNKKYSMLIEAEGYVPVEKPLYFGAELAGLKEVKQEIQLSKLR